MSDNFYEKESTPMNLHRARERAKDIMTLLFLQRDAVDLMLKNLNNPEITFTDYNKIVIDTGRAAADRMGKIVALLERNATYIAKTKLDRMFN
jgi:hypothetical protein